MKHLVLEEMPGNFELILGGDNHTGNADISVHKTKRLVEKVRHKKNGFIAFGGDQLESISVTDKRFNLDEHGGMQTRINMQRDAFIEDFKPLTGKILWMLDGNHELVWWNSYQVTADIAKALQTTYANGVMLKAIFPDFRLLDWHGSGYINSKAGSSLQRRTNDKISLMRKLRDLPGGDCEVMISHHYHKIMVVHPNENLEMISDKNNSELVQNYTQPNRIWIDQKRELYRIPEEDKWYACSGSLLRSYVEGRMSYAERFGFRPTELGVIRIIVQNDKIIKVVPDYLE